MDEKDEAYEAAKPVQQCRSSSFSASPDGSVKEPRSLYSNNAMGRLLTTLSWTPPWCRWTPGQPPRFSIWMNLLFACAGTCTVANLYYSHPILNILAHDFSVDYETVSQIPTLMQVGYAIGLFFLCPLGDVLKRRPFVLALVFASATLWIGLCITTNFTAFRVLSLLAAVSTVTPQIMLPLVGDLAPPEKRATALSIVVSGNFLGILLARILSGIVTEYTSWRNIYWLSLGLQYFVWIMLWLFMPDYPRTTTDMTNYFKILWSILKMVRKHPVLVQTSLIAFCVLAGFTSYWTTLTFLLAGAPYHYSTLVIGLFALIGVAGMLLGPVYAKLFIDRCVPAVSVYIGLLVDLIAVSIGTYTGTFTVAGPIIEAFGLDAALQITQVANRSSIFTLEPKARNRINTAFMVATFLGQIAGTAAGNSLYARSGWVASGSLSVGLIGVAVVLNTLRGPYEKGWIGWTGGWTILKRNAKSGDGMTDEKALEIRKEEVDEADIETPPSTQNTDREKENMAQA